MLKKVLGRTDLQVSIIGFGGIPVGSLDYSEAQDVIQHAFRRGINFFDTAPVYGTSESHLGRALEDVRDRCILATKTGEKTRAEAARSGIEASLKRLRTSYIDLIQLHGIDSEWTLEKVMAAGGVVDALKQARDQGKVRFLGITGHVPSILMKAIQTGEFDTVMTRFNINDREAAAELIPLARERDVGVIIMKPFGGRGTAWSPREIALQPVTQQLYNSARQHLGYVLNQPVSTTIPGFRSTDEVDAALQVVDETIRMTQL